jgi:hypothetical protein
MQRPKQKAFVKVLEALGVLKFDEVLPVRTLFDPQADAEVSAVIEKTLYEKAGRIRQSPAS